MELPYPPHGNQYSRNPSYIHHPAGNLLPQHVQKEHYRTPKAGRDVTELPIGTMGKIGIRKIKSRSLFYWIRFFWNYFWRRKWKTTVELFAEL